MGNTFFNAEPEVPVLGSLKDLSDVDREKYKARGEKIIQQALKNLSYQLQNSEEGNLTLAIISELFLNPQFGMEIRERSAEVSTMATNHSSVFYSLNFFIELYDLAIKDVLSSDDRRNEYRDYAVSRLSQTLSMSKPEAMKLIDTFLGKLPRIPSEYRDRTLRKEGRKKTQKEKKKDAEFAKSIFRSRIEYIQETLKELGYTKNAASGIDPVAVASEIDDAISAKFGSTYGMPKENGKARKNQNGGPIISRVSGWVGSVLVHEILHTLQEDTTPDPYRQRKLISMSGPRGDAAGQRLFRYLNYATDALINDMIINEMFKSTSDINTILPFGLVYRDKARFETVEDIYFDYVKEVCREMFVELGQEDKWKEPNNIHGAEVLFRRLLREIQKKKEEEQKQQGKDKKKQPQGGDDGRPSPDDGRPSPNGQPGGKEQGEGQEQGGQEQDEQGSGDADKRKGKGGKNGKNGDDDKGGAGGDGESLDDLMNRIEQEAIGKGKPVYAVDDHQNTTDLVDKRIQESGIDPENPTEGFEPVIRQIIDKKGGIPGLKGIGSDSILAQMLLKIAERGIDVQSQFIGEIRQELKSMLSPKFMETHLRRPPDMPALEGMLASLGRGTNKPAAKRLPNCGRILVGIDVSGSMSDNEVVEAALITLEILSKLGKGHRVGIAQMDGRVVSYEEMMVGGERFKKRVEEWRKKGFDVHGRGGTDFDDFFRKLCLAEKKKTSLRPDVRTMLPVEGSKAEFLKPDFVLIFSDMGVYFNNTPIPEDKKHIVFINTTNSDKYTPPPFGKVIACNDLLATKKKKKLENERSSRGR